MKRGVGGGGGGGGVGSGDDDYIPLSVSDEIRGLNKKIWSESVEDDRLRLKELEKGITDYKRDLYRRGDLIGEGGNGKIYMCKSLSAAGKKLVMKVQRKMRMDFELQDDGTVEPTEVLYMCRLNELVDPFVPELIDWYDDSCGETTIIMTLIEGMDLNRFANTYVINEHLAFALFVDIFGSIERLLRMGIRHGDLKLDNLMWDQKKHRVTVIDLGSSLTVKPGETTVVSAGTAYLDPPEFRVSDFDGEVTDEDCTVWALGLILYRLVFDSYPFSVDGVMDPISGCLHFPPNTNVRFQGVLRGMLEIDPEKRMSAKGIRHWIKNTTSLESTYPRTFILREDDPPTISSSITSAIAPTRLEYCWGKKHQTQPCNNNCYEAPRAIVCRRLRMKQRWDEQQPTENLLFLQGLFLAAIVCGIIAIIIYLVCRSIERI